AIILQYIVGGVVWVESRQSIRPQKWIALGLLVSGSSALSAWAVARPFLSALAGDFTVPLLGAVHISSVLFFDLGVYMLVVGATVLILVALAPQSLRFRRKAAPAEAPAAAAFSSSGAT